jgi:hypothetical protein
VPPPQGDFDGKIAMVDGSAALPLAEGPYLKTSCRQTDSLSPGAW